MSQINENLFRRATLSSLLGVLAGALGFAAFFYFGEFMTGLKFFLLMAVFHGIRQDTRKLTWVRHVSILV